MTTTVILSLPQSLESFMEERVKALGYTSEGDYLRDLVRKDETEAAKEKLRSLIMDGLTSPVGRSWAETKADLLARAQDQS